MPRLVVLSEGYTGRSYELKVEKTTIGRVDDNAFPIPDGSVSSHHCEVLLRGSEVVIKDLNSTNGTFISGQQMEAESEAVLKPGQILRLGSIDIRLEDAAPEPQPKKSLDRTQVIKQGVKLDEVGKTGTFKPETSRFFQKKSNKVRNIFIAISIVLGLVIIVVLALTFFSASSH